MSLRTGALAGALAAALATVVMLLLRLTVGVASLPELLQDWITSWLPVGVLGAYLGASEGGAKPLAFALLFALCLAGGAAVGALLGFWWGRRPPGRAGLYGQGLLTGLVLFVLAQLVLRPQAAPLGVGLPFLLYGLLLAAGYRFLLPVPPAVAPAAGSSAAPAAPAPAANALTLASDSRRAVIERVAWGGVAVAGSVALWRFVAQAREGPVGAALGMGEAPGSRETRRGDDGLIAEVTPTADFYVVSKNLRDPAPPDTEAWRLHVNGLVAQPMALTLEEVRGLAQRQQWQTLVCISNPVGGEYAGNALWRGVPVADLLAMTGGSPARAGRVVFRAADGYTDSLPMARAMDPSTLVATAMNGEDLPPAHGAPARLLVPGAYGIKNVKWLEAIEVVDTSYRGYWQRRGWSDSAVIKTMSRIDFPRRGAVAARDARRIAGIAYAGDRGISRVEVSEDDGQTWRPATFAPPRGPLSWVFWETAWSPAPGGQFRLTVRAADGRGDLQTTEETPSLPDGASGLHSVTVRVT